MTGRTLCRRIPIFSLLLVVSLLSQGLEARNGASLIALNKIQTGMNKYYSFNAANDLRGGAITNDDESEEDDEYDDEDEGSESDTSDIGDNTESNSMESKTTTSSGSSTILKVSMSIINTTGKILIKTFSVAGKVLSAAWEGDESNNDATITERVLGTLKRMVKAIFSTSKDGEAAVSDKKDKETTIDEVEDDPLEKHDFGTYLAKQYGVIRDTTTSTTTSILGGTVNDALKEAKEQARLLVVFIPAMKPSKKLSADKEAVAAVLSSDVAKTAEQKAKKKADTASFAIWSAKVGSSEAVAAMKRIKGAQLTNSKGQKRPILLVVYPATVVDPSTGIPKIVPRLLAQHHCSPPPTATKMVEWLIALRKRHQPQYSKMQKLRQEIIWQEERKAGYKGSVVQDIENRKRRKIEEERRKEKERIEEEKKQAILDRREKLKKYFEEQAATIELDNNNYKIISIRFGDGTNGKRRFASNTIIKDIFNWIDAYYNIERENIILHMMNGKQKFVWDDDNLEKTLTDVGFGKMIGLRVTIKETFDNDNENDNEKDSMKESS